MRWKYSFQLVISGEVRDMKLVVTLFAILFALTIKVHADNDSDKFWDRACLKKEMAPCGNEKLPTDLTVPFTEHQREVAACRIKALVKCRIHKNG
jgi:hypothetical protein